MDNRRKNMKIIAIVGSVILVAVMVFAIVSWVMTIGKVSVRVAYAPFASTVKLNGVIVKNDAYNYLAPGVYSLEVEFDDFEKMTREIEVANDTEYLFGSLIAINEKGEEYIKEYMDDFLTIEGIAGAVANQEGALQRQKMLEVAPVVASLPVKNSLYVISYLESEDGDDVKITISTNNTYMDEAVAKFKSLLNVDDAALNYNIDFLDYENLLVENFNDNKKSDLNDFLTTAFSGVDSFNIEQIEYVDDYACVKVTTGDLTTYSLMTYRMILKKISGGWEIIGEPKPILTRYNAKEVPEEVIDLVNNI